MGFSIWLVILASAAGSYFLLLRGYRLMLSLKSLRQEVERSQALIAAAQDFDEIELNEPVSNSGADLLKLLRQRHRIKTDREKRAEQRRRRLIHRISEIEIDKR